MRGLPTLLVTALMLTLAACTGDSAPSSTPVPIARPTGPGAAGPLIGYDAKRLFSEFGTPRLDIRERTVRKLQFGNGRCVLDTYLYALDKGREPVVTYVDARLVSGEDTDANACASSLHR